MWDLSDACASCFLLPAALSNPGCGTPCEVDGLGYLCSRLVSGVAGLVGPDSIRNPYKLRQTGC